MENAVGQTVIDTLAYLMSIVQKGTEPEEAKSGLRRLQQQHSDVAIYLVWELEAYDHSHHYDALLNLPEGGTVSISYCEDRAKPSPLRGVLRWSDADLLRVNNNVLRVDQAMTRRFSCWTKQRANSTRLPSATSIGILPNSAVLGSSLLTGLALSATRIEFS